MYLDYSKLKLDSFGRPEVPDLELQTLDGRPIGTIPYASNLKFHIKFSELSEMEFEIPRQANGEVNPLYDAVSGYKMVYTQNYGVYVVMDPVEESDGISDVKTVTCYSREKLLDVKRFFLAEGTYNFYNPASPADTLLGMIMESASGWSVGYVSPTLYDRYRTFDDYDDYLLSFIYGTAPEKYRCVFVFDTYKMTVNVYDADEERPSLPIYLDFDNLVTNLKVNEISDELITAMRPYGADSLDIRAVNPIGTNWIYNISYFIENGSIESELAAKWKQWQSEVESNRVAYNGLVGLQASTSAALLAENAKLTDMNGELQDLINQQSVNIQAQAQYPDDDDIVATLSELHTKIEAKKSEIATQEAAIENLESRLDPEKEGSYAAQIASIATLLSIENYFSDSELVVLRHYFIEQDMTDETFVSTNVNTAITGATYNMDGTTLAITGSSVVKVYVDDFDKTIYSLSGGSFETTGALSVSCDVVRGTLEVAEDKSFVMSVCAGAINTATASSSGGMLTVSGTLSSISDDTVEKAEGGITIVEGSSISLLTSTSSLYLTADMNEYQKYSVQMELLGHATKTLADVATPTYEFTVDSGNFIFAKEFEPFKNSLELGKGIYLRINDNLVITPIAIELEFDFEDQADFSLVFSNRFKRHDNVATLKYMLEKGYSSGRKFEADQYIYNQAANQMYGVTEFMNNSIDAAVNTIKAASNQSVVMDGSGLHIGGDGKYQMRLVDKMIAMTDDGWESAKLAIGLFSAPEIGEYWGVNADVIGGKLIVGNNLIVENDPMSFRLDSTGAWLYNSTFILQEQSNNGQMMLHPKYGLAAGTSSIYTTDGTTVTPSFIDDDDEVQLDKDGMPVNTNFFLDLRTGKVYLRGNIYAEDIYVQNGTFNGVVNARDGKFEGIVQASDFLASDGTSMLDELGRFKSDYLDLGNIQIDGTTGNITMSGSIDMGGSITLGGNIDLSGASKITWNSSNPPVKYQFSVNGVSGWHDTMTSSDYYRRDSLDGGITWGAAYQFRGKDGYDGSDGSDASVTFDNILAALQKANDVESTFITAEEVGTVNVYANNIYGGNFYAGTGSSTFANVNEEGFFVYADGSSVPKVMLAYDQSAQIVKLILGAGSSGTSSYINRLFLQKGASMAGMYYYDEAGDMCGFSFVPGGELMIHGKNQITFSGSGTSVATVDFSGVKVTGIYAKFK